jgi:hypothetical protein
MFFCFLPTCSMLKNQFVLMNSNFQWVDVDPCVPWCPSAAERFKRISNHISPFQPISSHISTFWFRIWNFFFTRPKTGSSLHVISLAVGHPHPLLADSWGADYGHWREGKAWITPRKFLSGQFEEHLTSNHWAYIFLYVLCVYIYSVCIYICSISIYIYIYMLIYT